MGRGLPKLVYTAAEAAEVMEMSETHLRRLVRAGVLKRVPHTGRSVRIVASSLHELIESREE